MQHFDDAKGVDLGRVDDKFYTGLPHERSAHAEKMQVRASRAESDSQFGGVHIAGCFARGNENFSRDFADLWRPIVSHVTLGCSAADLEDAAAK
jgi:hypothetical protein